MKPFVLTMLFVWLLSFNVFAQEPKLILPIGHTDVVNTAVFSPDGKRVVTASDDHTAKVWDAETGFLIATLAGHSKRVVSAVFSPDNTKILTASEDHTAKVWDAGNGNLIADLKSHTSPGNSDGSSIDESAVFSPDGKKVLTVRLALDNTVVIWKVKSGFLPAFLKGNTLKVISAVFSPDSKKILTISLDSVHMSNSRGGLLVSEFFFSSVKIWDAENGSLLVTLKSCTSIGSALFSPDGKRIIGKSIDSVLLFDNTKKNGVIGRPRLYNSVKVWDATTGHLVPDLKGHFSDTTAIYSQDFKMKVTAPFNGPAKVWNGEEGTTLTDAKGHSERVISAVFSADDKKLVVTTRDSVIKIWDAEKGKFIVKLNAHMRKLIYNLGINSYPYWTTSANFSPDSKKILTISGDHTVMICDANSGAALADLNGHTPNINAVDYSPDGKEILTASDDNIAKVWNADNGALKFHMRWYFGVASADISSPNGFWKVTASEDNTAKLCDLVSGRLLATLKGHKDKIISAAFSPDSKKIVTTSADGTAKVWKVFLDSLSDFAHPPGFPPKFKIMGSTTFMSDSMFIDRNNLAYPMGFKNSFIRDFANCTLLADLIGHTGKIKSAVFSRDNKQIVTISGDNTAKAWDAESGKLVYTFFAVDSTDYFNQIPSGYYKCTQNAAKHLHYVTKNLEVITFDQLDTKYNRPDKVLEAMGNPDTALIHAYRKAYEKRIKKLGIDTNSFKSDYSLPKSDFKNRDQIEYEQKKDKLSLHIFGSDSTYALERFNVWVNQVPVYGIRGISLKKRKRQTIDTTITISLSQGANRIETSVTDINGIESYHMPLYVKYTPVKPVNTLLYFVGIGTDKFADKNQNLNWSVKDIHDLALKFKEKYGKSCLIDTLFNENVTINKVIALKKTLLQSGVNDKVIIAFSGHGLFSKSYDYFLSTYSVNFKNPSQNGLPYDELENLLDNIPARKKLMLIDACHSGEIDKEEMTKQHTNMSMGSSFELMQQLFVNINKGTGATIIAAAGGRQYAIEKSDLKNGVFTYSILENMKQNPHVNISALQQYVNERVTKLSGGLQIPTARYENDAIDWQVW